MPAPPNYVFTIFAFVAFFLCLTKFPVQFRGRSQEVHVHIGAIETYDLFSLECRCSPLPGVGWTSMPYLGD